MSWDEGIAALEALVARVAPAGLAAVTAAQTPIFEASQQLVPVDTGRLKDSGLQQQEIDGTVVRGRISYGNETTLSGWGGRQSAGFGRTRPRSSGPIWADVGYEIFVHEGTDQPGHPPRKFLEQPVLDQMGDMGERMGTAFEAAL